MQSFDVIQSDVARVAKTSVLECPQCGVLTSKDSDEPVQPPFQLRNSKWCSFSSLTAIEYSSD